MMLCTTRVHRIEQKIITSIIKKKITNVLLTARFNRPSLVSKVLRSFLVAFCFSEFFKIIS